MTDSILLLSYFAPGRGHAGALRLLDLYRVIRSLQPTLNLELAACKHPDADWGHDEIYEIFDRVHWLSDKEYFSSSLNKLNLGRQKFDIVDLQYHQSGALIKTIRRMQPKSLVLFSPMESMVRASMLLIKNHLMSINLKGFATQAWLALQEAHYVMRADRVVCVSDLDLQALRALRRASDIFCLPTGLSPSEFSDCSISETHHSLRRNRSENPTLVIAAFFGSKTNRDALIWFANHVHPLIKKKIPNYTIRVVGRGAPAELIKFCEAAGLTFVGEVPSIETELRSAWAGISPALSGAGMRGKINQYAFLGLPCVASDIAAAGLGYESGKSILLARNPIEFSEQCLKLLTDDKLNGSIGVKAREICLRNYTWESMVNIISHIYNLAPKKNTTSALEITE